MPARTVTIDGSVYAPGDVNRLLIEMIADVWDTARSTLRIGVMASSGSQGTVSVSSTAAQVLATNANRLGGHVVNNSATTVWIGLDANTTAGEGGSNIGYLGQGDVFDFDFGGTVYVGSVYGITTSGSANLAFLELT